MYKSYYMANFALTIFRYSQGVEKNVKIKPILIKYGISGFWDPLILTLKAEFQDWKL